MDKEEEETNVDNDLPSGTDLAGRATSPPTSTSTSSGKGLAGPREKTRSDADTIGEDTAEDEAEEDEDDEEDEEDGQ